MSDVNTAPPAPPSAPSAPASNEVVIEQNPTSSPQPVGPQAPDKPMERAEARRDSIRKAFDRAKEDSDKAPPKKRGMGDNNPPEKMEQEKQGTLDLKKPPQAQGERYREQGRFAKQPDHAGAEPSSSRQVPAGADHKPAAPLPETAPYREPPPRFSERGRAEWAAAPEGVRGDVYRMAKEFEGAYRAYRGDHEEMNSIRNYHQMATEHGTTLARALGNYVSMEQKLRTDLVGGLDVIVNNLNLKTSDGQRIGLRDVAYHILNQSPDQHRILQQQNATQASQHQIGALHQTVSTLAQSVQQMQYGIQFGQTRSAVDQFADTHPGFDELGDLIEQELHFGFGLEEAYQRAARLRPPKTQAAQTRTAPAQTRSDKSIHGAPETGPSDGQRRKDGKQIGRREAIQNAIRRVNGGV